MNIQRISSRARFSVGTLVVAAALSACASAPIPEQQISLSKDAVNRAVLAEATQSHRWKCKRLRTRSS